MRKLAAIIGVFCVVAGSAALAEINSSQALLTPNAPPSTPPVVLGAQANTSHQTSAQPEHVLGGCELVNLMGEGQAELSPMVYVNSYYFNEEKINWGTATITIYQEPKHGKLEPDSSGSWTGAKYLPNDGYLGNDFFVILVEGSGYKVKLNYFLAVANDDTVAAYNLNPACKGTYWKITQGSQRGQARIIHDDARVASG
jgi:hypothetical protein